MGKKNWEKMAEVDDLSALGVSRHRGRGWKVFSGILFVGSAAFVTAYYVPLYRAHALLRDEYKTTSSQAATFRQQLVDTVATLKQTSDDCAKLQTEVNKQQKGAEVAASRIEHLERVVQIPLKKFLGKGRMTLERQSDRLHANLAAPAMVAATGGDLTDFGKKALCALASGIKDSNAKLMVQGLGVSSADKTGSAWELAATRAGNAAQVLGKTCGVDAARVEVVVRASTGATDPSVLAVDIVPGT